MAEVILEPVSWDDIIINYWVKWITSLRSGNTHDPYQDWIVLGGES